MNDVLYRGHVRCRLIAISSNQLFFSTPHLAFAVCYALFIYLLNLFLAFLQPKFDPQMYDDLASQDIEEGEPGLPTSASGSAANGFPSGAGRAGFGGAGSSNTGGGGLMSGMFGGGGGGSGGDGSNGPEEEFRPFIRRLPEFKVSEGVEKAQRDDADWTLADDGSFIYFTRPRPRSSGFPQHKPSSSRSSAH